MIVDGKPLEGRAALVVAAIAEHADEINRLDLPGNIEATVGSGASPAIAVRVSWIFPRRRPSAVGAEMGPSCAT